VTLLGRGALFNRWPTSSTGVWRRITFRITGANRRAREVKIAMLDTGIDEQHPALAGAVDDAHDFTNSRFGPADRNGHGTHTAGIVAARKDLLGVAPQCRLLIGKVLGDDGSGTGDAVAAGIDWACDAGADVISMSLGSPVPDPQDLGRDPAGQLPRESSLSAPPATTELNRKTPSTIPAAGNRRLASPRSIKVASSAHSAVGDPR